MKAIIKAGIGFGILAASLLIMALAWWATSYDIEGTFVFMSAMWVVAYLYIEIRHKGIKERNLIRRKRLAEGRHPETGKPLSPCSVQYEQTNDHPPQ